MDTEGPAPRKRRSRIDRGFGYIERRPLSERIVLSTLLLIIVIAGVWSLVDLSQSHSEEVSTPGGTLTEGVVGTPRFVNPVLALTRADRDLTSLVYAGLMRLGPDGELIPDVAESVTVSGDGLTYSITLRDDVRFHDGTPLTAEDVAFTINRIQEPTLQSPLRASMSGARVDVIGTHELTITLEEPYAPFIENLTVGILPRHIWEDASTEEFPFSQYNSEPIGAGPFEVTNIGRDTSGIPRSYELSAYDEYHQGRPNIDTLRFTFYSTEEALINAFNTGEVESIAGIASENVSRLTHTPETHEVITMTLPRTFAVFFNQNKSAALRDEHARAALDAAVDRTALVDSVLNGYAKPLTSPVPPDFGVTVPTTTRTQSTSTTPLDTARDILRDGGWSINNESGLWSKEIDGAETELGITIATANTPVFERTAEHLRETWEQLGVQVVVKQYEQSDLTQSIIRPREYEALLFGADFGRALDLYSFWHSSQRNDPGLNVALYANITTDDALTTARTSTSSSERSEAISAFLSEISGETPAVFLYSPELIYVFPKRITNATFTGVSEVSERFSSIANWSIATESVWPIFTDDSS